MRQGECSVALAIAVKPRFGAPWRETGRVLPGVGYCSETKASELLGGEMGFSKLGSAGGRHSSVSIEEGKEDCGLDCNFYFSQGLLCNLGMYCAQILILSFLSQKFFC